MWLMRPTNPPVASAETSLRGRVSFRSGSLLACSLGPVASRREDPFHCRPAMELGSPRRRVAARRGAAVQGTHEGGSEGFPHHRSDPQPYYVRGQA